MNLFTKTASLRGIARVSALMMLAMAITLSTGCSKTDPKDTGITVDKPELQFNGSASSQSVTVKSGADWSPTPSVGWITAEKVNNGSLKISVTAHIGENLRQGTVTLTTVNNDIATVTVKQQGTSPSIISSPSRLDFTAEGDTKTLEVLANFGEWDYECDAEWLVCEMTEDSKLEVTASATDRFSPRTTTITLMPANPAQYPGVEVEVEVTQEGKSYSIDVTGDDIADNKMVVSADADDYYATLTASADWEATAPDWISVDPESGEAAEGVEITIGVSENPDNARRTGLITFVCGTVEFKIDIEQAASGLFLEIDDAKIVASDEGATEKRTFNTSGTVTAEATEGNWVSGTVSENELTITVDPNPGEKRSTTLRVTAKGEGYDDITIDIPVTQVGTAINLSEDGTANCYIVPGAGTYKFNGTIQGKGGPLLDLDFIPISGSEKIMDPSGAVLVWGTEKTPFIENIEVVNGWVYFDATGVEGNAVIAVNETTPGGFTYKAWSWHLWATDFDPNNAANQYEVQEGAGTAKAGIWMKRNLGALATVFDIPNENPTDEDIYKSFGLHYQWGRKDPFPGCDSYSYSQSGYEDTFGAAMENANALIYYYEDIDEDTGEYSTSIPVIKTMATEYPDVASNVGETVLYPERFMTNTTSPYMWVSSQTGDDAPYPLDYDNPWGHLWGMPFDAAQDGFKSIYDPCPVGWKVPNGHQLRNVTSHHDSSGKSWGNRGTWARNCLEILVDIQLSPDPINGNGPIVLSTTNYNQSVFKWSTFRSGLHLFTNGNLIGGKKLFPDEPAGTEKSYLEWMEDPDDYPTEYAFYPAAGLRTYGGVIQRGGATVQLHGGSIRGANSYLTHAMEAGPEGNFYWYSRSTYNQQAGAVSVRCVQDPDETLGFN